MTLINHEDGMTGDIFSFTPEQIGHAIVHIMRDMSENPLMLNDDAAHQLAHTSAWAAHALEVDLDQDMANKYIESDDWCEAMRVLWDSAILNLQEARNQAQALLDDIMSVVPDEDDPRSKAHLN